MSFPLSTQLITSFRAKEIINQAFFFFFFFPFRAAATACGGSQSRGWIGVAVCSLHHSHGNAGWQPRLWQHSPLSFFLTFSMHLLRSIMCWGLFLESDWYTDPERSPWQSWLVSANMLRPCSTQGAVVTKSILLTLGIGQKAQVADPMFGTAWSQREHGDKSRSCLGAGPLRSFTCDL